MPAPTVVTWRETKANARNIRRFAAQLSNGITYTVVVRGENFTIWDITQPVTEQNDPSVFATIRAHVTGFLALED